MTTILVTGANRGIGLELVTQYAADGAEVIACCRAPEKADALNALVKKARNVRVAALDVADPQSVASLKSDLGDTPIDILINNAGVGGPRERAKGIIDADGWLGIFAVNSIAPVTMAAAFHDNLKTGRDKKLVTITSQLGSITSAGGAYPYYASKAAVNSFMHGLSKEWARDGILVGIFHPGWVKTDMGGQSAPVTPAQSAIGLRARIAELSVENSGSFRDYTGRELPW
ncbi:MAG TPA: SDR family oxidoreductase [Rhizomicrobium sp.]|nr:SDR family oxidoreductase [Rhizomicrobium sp.]